MRQGTGAFTVRFWGVRASIAAPGPDTVKYGGNTPCVEVRVGDEVLVLDCGTGMRDLGWSLLGEGPVRATILISRYEWDHIQGFPFFTPAFIQGNRFTVLGTRVNGTGVRDYLANQMNYPVFPVKLADLGASIDYQDLDTEEGFTRGRLQLNAVKSRQGTVVGYRIASGRKRLVYLFDPPADEDEEKTIAAQAKNAVILYALPAEPANGHDDSAERWGAALRLADRAKARQLIIFHHRPGTDDHELSRLERKFRRKNKNVVAAYEGLALDV